MANKAETDKACSVLSPPSSHPSPFPISAHQTAANPAAAVDFINTKTVRL